ncbi:UDP-N-acetylglucosamine transferase subunit ALG14 [bacterium]|nr:UDP-N-acetylglucosamine transferase subunit ALG14 [bacterium]
MTTSNDNDIADSNYIKEFNLKKKILVVLGGGGHTAQMIRLVDMLGDKHFYLLAILNMKIEIHRRLNPIMKVKKICLLSFKNRLKEVHIFCAHT